VRRRDFIAGLGGAAAWPAVARAQQPAMPLVGLLSSFSDRAFAGRMNAFYAGLGDAGYANGRNVRIEPRLADGSYDRLAALATDLVQRQPIVIAALDIWAAKAAKVATASIPIVFRTGVDPIATGLVGNLSRPEGNLTGITSLNVEVTAKRLELLHELLPDAGGFGLLLNPSDRVVEETQVRQLQTAARDLQLRLHVVQASSERELELAFARLTELGSRGVVIGGDVSLFANHIARIAELAVRYSMPAVYQFRDFPAAGGLMSYGGSLTESYRMAGIYTGRILKGEKPADLPVQQATKVELIVNLKTAKALRLTIPPTLLARADEVIE
jgi:putative tryptophan/tyrosine transport system substrate-binding protein